MDFPPWPIKAQQNVADQVVTCFFTCIVWHLKAVMFIYDNYHFLHDVGGDGAD